MVHLQGLLHLFGRHVMRRAHHFRRPRQPLDLGVFAQEFGQTKVGNLHSPLFVHEHILGFDVTVDDTAIVRVLECLTDLRHDGHGFAR